MAFDLHELQMPFTMRPRHKASEPTPCLRTMVSSLTSCTRRIVRTLTRQAAYGAVLARAKLGGLRLLPISGGIFAGRFAPELPALTDAVPSSLPK